MAPPWNDRLWKRQRLFIFVQWWVHCIVRVKYWSWRIKRKTECEKESEYDWSVLRNFSLKMLLYIHVLRVHSPSPLGQWVWFYIHPLARCLLVGLRPSRWCIYWVVLCCLFIFSADLGFSDELRWFPLTFVKLQQTHALWPYPSATAFHPPLCSAAQCALTRLHLRWDSLVASFFAGSHYCASPFSTGAGIIDFEEKWDWGAIEYILSSGDQLRL